MKDRIAAIQTRINDAIAEGQRFSSTRTTATQEFLDEVATLLNEVSEQFPRWRHIDQEQPEGNQFVLMLLKACEGHVPNPNSRFFDATHIICRWDAETRSWFSSEGYPWNRDNVYWQPLPTKEPI